MELSTALMGTSAICIARSRIASWRVALSPLTLPRHYTAGSANAQRTHELFGSVVRSWPQQAPRSVIPPFTERAGIINHPGVPGRGRSCCPCQLRPQAATIALSQLSVFSLWPMSSFMVFPGGVGQSTVIGYGSVRHRDVDKEVQARYNGDQHAV